MFHITHCLLKLPMIFVILSPKIFINAKTMSFISSEVAFNHRYLQDHRLDVHNGTMDIILNVARNLTRDPWFNIAFNVQTKGNAESYRSLLHYDVNICQVMGKGGSKMLTNMVKGLLRQGQFPTACPILKGNYSICQLQMSMLPIPPFMIAAIYKVTIDSYVKLERAKVSLANLTIFAEIK